MNWALPAAADPVDRAWNHRCLRWLIVLGLAAAGVIFFDATASAQEPSSEQFCTQFGGSTAFEVEAVCPGPITTVDEGISGSTQRQIQQRLQRLRCEGSDDPACAGAGGASQDSVSYEGLGIFVSADYQHKDKEQTNFEMGFKSDSYGPTLGVDYQFGTTGVIGGAFDFSHTDGEFDNDFGDFNTDTFTAVFYGSYYPTDQSFIDVALGFGHKEYETEHADPGLTDNEVKSDTTGFEFTTDVIGGYDFNFGSVTVGPRAGIHYKRTALDGFTETGDPAATLFAYEDQAEDSLTGTVGFQASMAFSTDFGVVVPTVNAEYVREFLDDRERHTVIDEGGNASTFVTDQPDRNHFNLGAGVVVVLPDGISPFLNYEVEVANYLEETHTLTGGVRLGF
jgi:outer membrane lipase/esterase